MSGSNISYTCKKCSSVFQRYYELIRHQKNHCFKEENNKKSAKAQIAAAQIAQQCMTNPPPTATTDLDFVPSPKPLFQSGTTSQHQQQIAAIMAAAIAVANENNKGEFEASAVNNQSTSFEGTLEAADVCPSKAIDMAHLSAILGSVASGSNTDASMLHLASASLGKRIGSPVQACHKSNNRMTGEDEYEDQCIEDRKFDKDSLSGLSCNKTEESYQSKEYSHNNLGDLPSSDSGKSFSLSLPPMHYILSL